MKSTTTGEFLKRTLTYARENKRLSSDIKVYWTNLEKLKSADEPLNDKLLNDLVDIHTQLVTTSNALEIAVQKMAENCKK
jgi:hypothetical protein